MNKKKIYKWYTSMKPVDWKKLLLQTKADAYNAGFGKKVRRVIFCKDAGEWVEQTKVGLKEWLCLHD